MAGFGSSEPRDEAERLVAAVRRFHTESGYGVGPAQVRAIDALCADPTLGRAWLLADGRGRDVGYALACWRCSIDHGGRVAVLDDLRVEPGARGRGLGTQLLNTALAQMEQVGARRSSSRPTRRTRPRCPSTAAWASRRRAPRCS